MMAKAYGEYTLADHIRLGLSFLGTDNGEEMDEAALKEDNAKQGETLKYIETMANAYNINAAQIKTLELFGDETRKNRLILDRTEINKRILAFWEAYAADSARQNLERLKKNKKNLQCAASNPLANYSSRVNDGLSRIRDFTRNIADYEANITSYMGRIRQENDKISDILSNKTKMILDSVSDKGSVTLNDELVKICEGGNWTFSHATKSGDTLILFLLLDKDIILYERNAAAGVDIATNFGTFYIQLEINAKSGAIIRHRVKGYSNFMSINDHIHPHVGSGGSMCLGEVQNQYRDAANDGRLYDALEIIRCVLTQYNSGSPYVNLSTYHERAKGSGRRYSPDPLKSGGDASKIATNLQEVLPETTDEIVEGEETTMLRLLQSTKDIQDDWTPAQFDIVYSPEDKMIGIILDKVEEVGSVTYRLCPIEDLHKHFGNYKRKKLVEPWLLWTLGDKYGVDTFLHALETPNFTFVEGDKIKRKSPDGAELEATIRGVIKFTNSKGQPTTAVLLEDERGTIHLANPEDEKFTNELINKEPIVSSEPTDTSIAF